MKLIETGNGCRYIQDAYGAITAQRFPNQPWHRTYPPNQYDLAPPRQAFFDGNTIIEEIDITPRKPTIATRLLYQEDYQAFLASMTHDGFLETVRSLSPSENALLAIHFIDNGDLLSAMAIRQEVACYIYGSHIYTDDPKSEMSKFDQALRENL